MTDPVSATRLGVAAVGLIQTLIQLKSTIGEAGDSINALIDAIIGTELLIEEVKVMLPVTVRHMSPGTIDRLRRLIFNCEAIIAKMRKTTSSLLAHVNATKLEVERQREEEKEKLKVAKNKSDGTDESDQENKLMSFDLWARPKAAWNAQGIEKQQVDLVRRVAAIMQICIYCEKHLDQERPIATISCLYETSKQLGDLNQSVAGGTGANAQAASTAAKSKSERMFDLLWWLRGLDPESEVTPSNENTSLLGIEEQAKLREHVHVLMRGVSIRRQELENRHTAHNTSSEAAADFGKIYRP